MSVKGYGCNLYSMSQAAAPQKKNIRLEAPLSWWEVVEGWRQAQPDVPNLSESIRRLVLVGVQADTAPKLRRN